ncbi:MAG TPA: tetratricopeptide repeat protein [Acetobacteraceae bacterium]|nr:tetratricopeptide repeat protein [Acetobacteraceae bacterium]
MPHPLRSTLLAAALFGLLARPGLAAEPADPPSAAGAYLAGDFAISRGDMAQATDDFLAALASDPQNLDLTRHAFLAALMSSNPAAAQLARALPGDEAATLLLADDDVALADWSGALHRFESLPDTGVIALMRPLLVAWAQYGAGDTDAALATLQPPPGQRRIPGVYVLHAAMIADLAGRIAEADTSYRRAASASAQPPDLREGQILASWQMRQGQPDAAAATLRQLGGTSDEIGLTTANLWRSAMRRPVGSAADGIAEAYLEMASAMRAQDATDFAQILLRLALDLRPDFSAARLMLAEIDDAAGRQRRALDELAAIPVNDPLAPMAAMRRALLRDDMGDPARAIADLRTLAAAHPHHSAPLVALGDTLRQEHHYRAAIAAYSQALTLLPGPEVVAWSILFSRGVAYDRLGDWPHAEADLRAALALAPQRPSLLNYLGYSLADRGIDLTEARSMIARALQQRPHDAAILDSMGWVMLRQGQVADAIAMLLRAVEASPEDAIINGHLGDAYAAAGETLQAGYQWRRALALHPEPHDAARLEAKLRQNLPAPAAQPLAASVRAAAPVR